MDSVVSGAGISRVLSRFIGNVGVGTVLGVSGVLAFAVVFGKVVSAQVERVHLLLYQGW